jgi:hypothetical protein
MNEELMKEHALLFLLVVWFGSSSWVILAKSQVIWNGRAQSEAHQNLWIK